MGFITGAEGYSQQLMRASNLHGADSVDGRIVLRVAKLHKLSPDSPYRVYHRSLTSGLSSYSPPGALPAKDL
jgi:hypothetical protein